MEKLVLTNSSIAKIKSSIVEGLETASGSRSSATYYHSKDEQMKAIKAQTKNLYNVSKELPLIIASQKGATGRFVSEVLLNEFKSTSRGGACNIVNPIDWYDNGLSDKAVLSALSNLAENGLPYVLRLFVDMKEAKVNNERSRKIMLGFLWGQDNLEFYSLKYRNKIAEALRHVYGQKITSVLLSIAQKNTGLQTQVLIGNEKELAIVNDHILKYYNGTPDQAFKLLLFLFKKDSGVSYNELPLLAEYQKAKVNIVGIKTVPEEILLGLISNKKHPQYATMWATELQRQSTKALIRTNVEVTSVNQQVRQTKSTAKLGVEKVVDLEKATDFMALYKTGFETSFTPEIGNAISKLADAKKIEGFFYQSIGIICDDSASMAGNKNESKNTPLAIADFTSKVLVRSTKTHNVVHTDGFSTDIASAFVKLLKGESTDHPYDAIFILTDGYENSYDGLTNEVITIFQQETNRNIPIFQISPMVSAEMGANVRKLGDGVVTMAVNNPNAIMPQINARLLEVDAKRWLENQVLLLEGATVKRSKKINVNV